MGAGHPLRQRRGRHHVHKRRPPPRLPRILPRRSHTGRSSSLEKQFGAQVEQARQAARDAVLNAPNKEAAQQIALGAEKWLLEAVKFDEEKLGRAPDTLWCYPFNTDDPFLIREAPDIYFVGNQPSFATTTYENLEGHQTRVVLLPRFSQTGDVVLVTLRTLECELVNVGSAL
ncbi:hypothetical protein CF319_g9293 [Tilletia indica]|nr:hypothetical protein CF319_g9293 [Tilletia indica]